MHLGRDFLPHEDKKGADPVVILGYGVWKTRYGGDAEHPRQSRSTSTRSPATIVGVMPEGVQFPNNADIWQPLIPNQTSLQRSARNMTVFGRLGAGIEHATGPDGNERHRAASSRSSSRIPTRTSTRW